MSKIINRGDLTFRTSQRGSLFTAWSSNQVDVTQVTITEGEFDGTGASPSAPAVYIVDRANFGPVAYLVDGPHSAAAFVCKGTHGYTMDNATGRDGMATGTYIEVTLERSGWGSPIRAMVPLHNRFEIGER